MEGRVGAVGRSVLLVSLIGLTACSVLTRAHEATVLDAPTQGDGAVAPDWWNVRVELSSGDVAGSTDVVLGFDRRALLCDDGSELAPRDLGPSTTIRFVREDDSEVETSDPPAIRVREIRAECRG